jgi:hypothetical protein
VVDLRARIAATAHVILERTVPPVPEIVAAVLPLLPIAATAPVTAANHAPPARQIVAPVLRLPLQPSAAMAPAMGAKIVRHVHKTALGPIHATIAPLQPGRPHPGWSVEPHVEI